ncbi:NUDIX domain-containing protein [Clostridium sp. MB05]|jgi:8-oxo-dGTP diphosphatase|uniref:NUDIX hydrolase n=1 Tax=Clostridium sp. MB05 TaxID=3376682 RepID=UPI003982C82E
MIKVNFYDLNTIDDSKVKFAVIVTKYKGKLVYVRHKDRQTWEMPGGHREENESISKAASRELVEETGAKSFNITPICIYSVENNKDKSFGSLSYADVYEFDELPNYEIAEIKLFDKIPENLTYPLIQPYLAKKFEEFRSLQDL